MFIISRYMLVCVFQFENLSVICVVEVVKVEHLRNRTDSLKNKTEQVDLFSLQ